MPPAKAELISVRVVDLEGRGVPNIEVEVVDQRFSAEHRRYRSGADGRFRFPTDSHFKNIELEAHPDDRTFGWARVTAGSLFPPSDQHPATLMLLPLNHHVEGSIVDSRGKPIGGVRIKLYQIHHEETNEFGTGSSLSPAVTDDAGRFAFELPANTRVSLFGASHPRYAGPWFHYGADDRIIPPVTLIDAGGIAGTVTDSTTGKKVAGARVQASLLENGRDVPKGGGGGDATTDANGQFQIGGLPPGVYNLLLNESPRGRRYPARAVEGVRVKAGDDARADLVIVEGRRLHGTAIDRIDNTPIVDTYVMCRWGGANQTSTETDNQGRFEFFIPPGRARVSIPADEKTLIVPADRDAETVCLEINPNRPRPDRESKWAQAPECLPRVRVSMGEAGAGGHDMARTLSGRIFDPAGRPIASVRVYYRGKSGTVAATDRLGVFRMRGLPRGPFRLDMDKLDNGSGWSTIPADAVEVDLTLPPCPNALE